MNWLDPVVEALARGLEAFSPSCKEAACLQSAALDGRLTLLERVGLRCHLMLCKWCRRYGDQLKLLRSAAREHAQDDQHSPLPALSSQARERINRMLQSEKE
jgi:predicted anti-sigma-YlaC factor YlaD